jgi:RimJ/RimL family protein N-acetyltransferase
MDRIPRSYLARAQLPDGRDLVLRPIRPDDRNALHAEFLKLGKATVRNRFFAQKTDLTPEELTYFTEVDLSQHVALVAEIEDDTGWRAVGVARFVRDRQHPDNCEAAITIIDAFQGIGIGRILLQHLIECARELGVHRFDATVLPQNRRMSRLLRRTGLPLESSIGDGMLRYSLTL